MDLTTATVTNHAREQMARRGITDADVMGVLRYPLQVIEVRSGRVVAQGMHAGQLLRAFVDVDRAPPLVVTVYLTSKIDKYRSNP